MPVAYMPTVDNAACAAWSEQDTTMYNALPFYFVKLQIEYRKNWAVWAPLFGKIKWEPNMGPIMRGVRVDPSPNIRQTAYPSAICAIPHVDEILQNEVTVDAFVFRHRFESKVFDFCPDFRTFITDHIDRNVKDINEKVIRFEDIYNRTQVLEGAPFIWVANKNDGTAELTAVPVNTTGVQTKTAAMLAALGNLVGNPGNLSLCTIDLAQTIAENDLRVPPFSGSTKPVDNAGLDDKWVLVLGSEAWNQFKYDPWMLANRPIDLNVVTEKFKGSLWGKMTCRLEDLPLRMAADGTFPAPQTVELNPAAYNYGETVSNPAYNACPFEFAWLVGAEAYKTIEVGPPPKQFASNGMPNGFGKMMWNGEVFLSKNILVPCSDVNGNIIQQPNVYGEKLKAFCQATFGAIGVQRRNIIPILFRRKRGC
jgi:hypothetical protein